MTLKIEDFRSSLTRLFQRNLLHPADSIAEDKWLWLNFPIPGVPPMAAALIDQLGNAKEAIQKSMQDRLKVIHDLTCDRDSSRSYEIKIDEICLDSKATEGFRNRLENCDGLKILYALSVTSYGDLGGPGNLVDVFRHRKGESERAYARWNKHSDSSFLYVGSSNSLRDRVKQHLGFGPKRTYALQLADWLKSYNVTCILEYFAVSTQDQQALEDIEDGFWQILRPLFGKNGGK